MTMFVDDRKIKVVFFDEAVAYGGSVVVLAHLFNNIDRTKFTPLLVSSLDEKSLWSLFRPEDVLHRLHLKLHYGSRAKWMKLCPSNTGFLKKVWAYSFTIAGFFMNLFEHINLLRKVAKTRPQLIHVNNGGEGPFISKIFRVPMIWHVHGTSCNFVANTPAAKNRSAVFISISRYISLELMKQGIRSDQIFDIPNPAPTFTLLNFDRDSWLTSYGIPKNAVVFSHVGRLIRWKGQTEFLNAFSKIATKHPHTFALIVGDDAEGFSSEYPKKLRELARNNNLNGRVFFTGHVNKILELMSFSDVIVHSSIEPEPFGLVITEAMSAGAAVIAARLGAPSEIIEEGVTGLLIDPRNTEEFSAALETLTSDTQLRKKIARAGTLMVQERYSPQLFSAQVEAVYKSVINASGKTLCAGISNIETKQKTAVTANEPFASTKLDDNH